jgi:hypothetical protein
MRSYFFDGGQSDPEIELPIGRVVVEVLKLVYEAPEEFGLSGKFEADGASAVAIHANTDWGTAWMQGNASTAGNFSLYFAPDDEDVDSGSVLLDSSDDSAWCEDAEWKENSSF